MPPWTTSKPTDVNGQFSMDPLGFMRTNIVFVNYHDEAVSQTGGIGLMTLVLQANVRGESFHGAQLPVYFLSNGRDAPGRAIRAYWCPYQEDRLKLTTVWKHADFMFTETMTGCSFAIGSTNSTGSVLVGHANAITAGGDGGPDAQQAEQRRVAQARFGANATLFEPEKYRTKTGEDTRLTSTTFGVRNRTSGVWTFYAQLRETSMSTGNPVLRAVKKIG